MQLVAFIFWEIFWVSLFYYLLHTQDSLVNNENLKDPTSPVSFYWKLTSQLMLWAAAAIVLPAMFFMMGL